MLKLEWSNLGECTKKGEPLFNQLNPVNWWIARFICVGYEIPQFLNLPGRWPWLWSNCSKFTRLRHGKEVPEDPKIYTPVMHPHFPKPRCGGKSMETLDGSEARGTLQDSIEKPWNRRRNIEFAADFTLQAEITVLLGGNKILTGSPIMSCRNVPPKQKESPAKNSPNRHQAIGAQIPTYRKDAFAIILADEETKFQLNTGTPLNIMAVNRVPKVLRKSTYTWVVMFHLQLGAVLHVINLRNGQSSVTGFMVVV